MILFLQNISFPPEYYNRLVFSFLCLASHSSGSKYNIPHLSNLYRSLKLQLFPSCSSSWSSPSLASHWTVPSWDSFWLYSGHICHLPSMLDLLFLYPMSSGSMLLLFENKCIGREFFETTHPKMSLFCLTCDWRFGCQAGNSLSLEFWRNYSFQRLCYWEAWCYDDGNSLYINFSWNILFMWNFIVMCNGAFLIIWRRVRSWHPLALGIDFPPTPPPTFNSTPIHLVSSNSWVFLTFCCAN